MEAALELPKSGLVTWTGSNVSACDPETNLVVLKPSGVMYDDLRPEDHVVLDLEGNIVEGTLKPSSDTASHLYVYRNQPNIHGIGHTLLPYATAFAALGRPIPVYLTAIADEFGGPIPCAGFALIGGEEIGQQVVEHIGDSPAVLLKNHGVFTTAIKAAVMTEDLARTVWYALQPGTPDEIAPEVLPSSITATPMCTGNKRARCGVGRWSTNCSARAQDTTREASRYD